MLDQVLSLFDIVPDYDLDLMQKDQDLYDITANSLKGIRKVIQESKPTHIIVHGDTTTTLTGALAGFYSNIEVCHVEAGLRTYDLKKPFPEEANRQIVSKLTTHHFCPTIESKSNLIKEGIDENKILITGNTVIDTLRLAQDIINNDTNTRNKIQQSLENKIYKEFYKDKYILITGHRRESFGSGFTNICESISKLAEENSNINFIYPVHLNPNVSTPVNEILSKYENVFLIDPLDYIDFVFLLMGSFFVLTDSGGIQEEAPSLGKPVLVMRDKTERPEAVNAGTVKLVGSSFNKIYEGATQLIKDKNSYKKMARSINPYGDGEAAARIRDYFETI